MVTNTKFDVEKFDGTNNFGMWQCEVQDILFQQELDVALEESRPEDVDTTRKNAILDIYYLDLSQYMSILCI